MTSDSIKAKWSSFFSNDYQPAEWLSTKLAVVLFVAPGLIYVLFNRQDAPYPLGLCRVIDCNMAFAAGCKWFLVALIVTSLLLFLFEVKMVYTTLVLFLLSLLIYSIEESQGLRGRKGVLSLMFFAFFLAYLFEQLKWNTSLARNRIQFPAQFIAAAYVLAAISKLTTSGLSWISDSPFVALQILKSFDYAYFDTGVIENTKHGVAMASRIAANIGLVKVLFACTLFLELFAFVILLRKGIAFAYALCLVAMHMGMLIVMDIFFPTISIPLIIFIINPFYLVYLAGCSVLAWVREHTAARA